MAPAEAPLQPGYSTVPAAACPALASLAAPGRSLSVQGHPETPQWSSASVGAKCQTTQVPAARGHQANGECYVQQCMGRENVWMGRGASSTAELEGGTGRWSLCQLFAPHSLSLLCSQPALGRSGMHVPSHRDLCYWPNRAMAVLSFVSRILSQGNHTVLPPRNTF